MEEAAFTAKVDCKPFQRLSISKVREIWRGLTSQGLQYDDGLHDESRDGNQIQSGSDVELKS
jgi:hypothetical protein